MIRGNANLFRNLQTYRLKPDIKIGIYILYIIFLAVFRPETVPALPPEARTLKGKALRN